MKYYKDSQNHVYAFEADGSQDSIIPEVLTSITTEEADLIRNPIQTINDVRTTILRTIVKYCDAEINAVKNGYPDSEILTWDKQEAEARAFIADVQAATPLLDALSAARGIAKAELAARVIVKADTFAAYTGALIGKRQALEDQLDAITLSLTAEELAVPITPAVQAQIDAVQW